MDKMENFNVIKQFFDLMGNSNKPLEHKTCECSVTYKTYNDKSDFIKGFTKKLPVSVNISNRNFYSVYIEELDSDKYHIEFRSNYQDFSFDPSSKALTVEGIANGKKFAKYKVGISIICEE